MFDTILFTVFVEIKKSFKSHIKEVNLNFQGAIFLWFVGNFKYNASLYDNEKGKNMICGVHLDLMGGINKPVFSTSECCRSSLPNNEGVVDIS